MAVMENGSGNVADAATQTVTMDAGFDALSIFRGKIRRALTEQMPSVVHDVFAANREAINAYISRALEQFVGRQTKPPTTEDVVEEFVVIDADDETYRDGESDTPPPAKRRRMQPVMYRGFEEESGHDS